MAEITLADLAKAREIRETAMNSDQNPDKSREEGQQEEGALQTAAAAQAPAFTEAERKRIDEIKEAIDLTDSQAAVQYGVGAQRSLSEFADSVLANVRAKDSGYVGELLTELVVNVKELDVSSPAQEDGLLDKLPFFKNARQSLRRLKERYAKVEVQIDRIEGELEKARMQMLRDIGMFDTMYQKNLEYFNELKLYIAAGEETVEEMRSKTLPQLRAEAATSGEPMQAQLVSDFEDTVNRFEKKLYDLKLSKTIAIQTAPQIKLIQNNDKLLVEKIQTAILNTIPIWKGQIVIALGLQSQQKTLKLQQDITDATNDLLTKNAELLKTNTIETAKASEEGIVKLETLKTVNSQLIATIQETIKIQKEGREKRREAEAELLRLEEELKTELLQSR